MCIIQILVTIVTKVPHPKKSRDIKGEPTHRTKDKYQIEKMPSDLITDDLVEIRSTQCGNDVSITSLM